MRVGVIACEIIRLELEHLLVELEWEPDHILFLDSALHNVPDKMRTTLVEKINEMAPNVDAILLGYGTCQSLENIQDEVATPLIHPKVDDCLCMMLGPDQYAAELEKQAGTWFMTPGWADVGVEMVIKELKLDRVKKMGKDPMEFAKMMFSHYKRVLLIDTGVGNEEKMIEKSREFCHHFNLGLDRVRVDIAMLKEYVIKAKDLAASDTLDPDMVNPKPRDKE
ncbi:MAG: DUF1638 domain-containing protein [Desulfovibrionales bacterium]|nr:DUF1638 domain-containing protein [Desulfovibrionales bacterium]